MIFLKWLLILCSLFLCLSCNFLDPDPFGCNSRGKLVIKNENLPNGKINSEYCEQIKNAYGFGYVELTDSASNLPSGLEIVDSTFGVFLKGVPEKSGSFSFSITCHEHGTQCVGRTASFIAFITISD